MRWSGLAILVVGSTLAVTASAAPPTAPTPAFSGQEPLATGDGPSAVAVADLNGDRKLDLLTANAGASTVSVLLNDGRGRFQQHRDFAAPRRPQSLAVADVDGDGRRDVLTADNVFREGVACGTVSVFLNGQAAQFRLDQTYKACTSGWVGTGDLNGDGTVDFATVAARCCWGGSGLFVALNDGGGSFEVASCSVSARMAAIGDVNGDGKQDLVASGGAGITVIVNDGAWANCGYRGGTYRTGEGTGTASLALVDLNGDGKRDVVTPASRADAISVLLNRGGGHFDDYTDYPTGDAPASLAVADVNRDHRLDVVTANSGAGTISVLVGRGDGTFDAKRDFKANGNRPSSVAIGDLNGDGLPDLAAANSDADSVSVFFNRTKVCRVPNVKGKGLDDAKRALARAHCRSGTLRRASSTAAKEGRVVAERPAPGTVLPTGSLVNLVIGRG